MSDSDRELIRQALAGSDEAAGQLFRRYWRSAWHIAYAITGRSAAADDVAQDSFCRAFAALPRVDGDRPFFPWLKKIVVNRAIDEIRRDRPSTELDEGLAEPDVWSDEIVDRDAVLSAMRRLDADQRTVIVLRVWFGYHVDDVAKLLDIPRGTVMSRQSRGLASLRRNLEESWTRS